MERRPNRMGSNDKTVFVNRQKAMLEMETFMPGLWA